MEEDRPLDDAKTKRVLVVDDDEGNRDLIAAMVRKEGFQVEEAFDGQDALDKIGRAAPDLMVLDLMMPRYGGYEVLRRLQEGENARIPVIVVTGRMRDRSTMEMIRQESNVVEFMEKPVKSVLFGMTLHRVLHTKPG
ncbi:MAG: response regulator [Elusimicrobia bacterium]|nr:response regulator [Elusimicrobiota bacterium]